MQKWRQMVNEESDGFCEVVAKSPWDETKSSWECLEMVAVALFLGTSRYLSLCIIFSFRPRSQSKSHCDLQKIPTIVVSKLYLRPKTNPWSNTRRQYTVLDLFFVLLIKMSFWQFAPQKNFIHVHLHSCKMYAFGHDSAQ